MNITTIKLQASQLKNLAVQLIAELDHDEPDVGEISINITEIARSR